MKKSLASYIACLISFLTDTSQRVRHAALGSIALFAEAFAEENATYNKLYAYD